MEMGLGQQESIRGSAPAGLPACDWQPHYATAIEASGQLVFEWDLASGQIQYPLVGERGVFGHAVAAVDSLARWVQYVHADDRERFLARLEESVGRPEPASQVFEYRFRRADGEFIWLEARSRQLFEHGKPLARCVGLLADVTARKQIESRLGLSALILQSIREAVAVVDEAGRVGWANAAFDALVGSARGGSFGREWAECCAANDAPGALLQARLLERAALLGHENTTLRVDSASGVQRILELSVTCVVGDRAPLWIILHRDVSERVVAEDLILRHNLGEQSRLGVALHEGLGQDLAGASLLLRAARADLLSGADADEALASIEALLQSAVGRCANLAQRLSPFLLDRSGLANAIGDLVRRSAARTGRVIGFEVIGAIDAGIDSATAYQVFRVAQTALELALQRPSGRLQLSLSSHPIEGLHLLLEAALTDATVADFTADTRSATMRRRAETLGGSFEWRASPSDAICAVLDVPSRRVLPRPLAATA